jgi:hypothetical protein
MRKGQRVSWIYQGKRTFGTVTAMGGARAAIKSPRGGNIVRVGTADDPVVKLKSESTGNPVLKRRSQLKAAPKKK